MKLGLPMKKNPFPKMTELAMMRVPWLGFIRTHVTARMVLYKARMTSSMAYYCCYFLLLSSSNKVTMQRTINRAGPSCRLCWEFGKPWQTSSLFGLRWVYCTCVFLVMDGYQNLLRLRRDHLAARGGLMSSWSHWGFPLSIALYDCVKATGGSPYSTRASSPSCCLI